MSWRKANVRPPSSLRPNLEGDREIFNTFISYLEKWKFTIVYIDECSFNPSTFPLYTWCKRGEDPDKLIRSTSDRYNWIAAQVDNYKLFHVKKQTTTEDDFSWFLVNLKEELQLLLSKKQLETRTVWVFDNAAIHWTDLIKRTAQSLDLVWFTIPPYSPEFNRIENTFGVVKSKLCKENLANKTLMYLLKKVIRDVS